MKEGMEKHADDRVQNFLERNKKMQWSQIKQLIEEESKLMECTL